MKTAKVADLIILDKNKVLLAKRAKKECEDCWSIPGGTVEKGETFEFAMQREIKEELNCQIKKYDFFNKYIIQIEEDIKVEAHYFFGEIFGETSLSPELKEFAWFDLNKETVNKLDMAFNQKEVLLDFIKSRND